MNRTGPILILLALAGLAATLLVLTGGGDGTDPATGPAGPSEPGVPPPVQTPDPDGPPAPEGGAPEAAPGPEGADVPASGLFGIVVDAGGEPVAGASVKAQSGAGERGEATSDEVGRFAIGVEMPGTYFVTARADGYAPGRLTSVTLEEGGRVEDLVLTLRPGAVVTGRVYDADGSAVAGATVRVLSADAASDPMSGAIVADSAPSAETDGEGRFRVDGVAAGELRVEARADGRAPGRSEPFRIEEGGSAEVDVVFPGGPVVTGIVVDRRGDPVAGAEVGPAPVGMRALVPGAFGGPTASTKEDGTFSLGGLEGATELRAVKEGYGRGTVGGVLPDQRGVRIRLTDLGSISGRVIAEGAENVAFEVEARSESGGFMGMGALRPSGTPELGEEGRFRIVDVPPGSYEVTAWPETMAPARVEKIEVKEGEETGGVVLRLVAGETLRGIVVSAAGGVPVAGAEVSASLLTNPMIAQAGRGRKRSATTGEDGAFELPGLPAGATTVAVQHAGFAPVTLPAVTVPTREPLRIELEAGGTVLVTALRADGSPDLGKMVMLRRNVPFAQRMTAVDESGRARFTHVPPGTWMVMRMDVQAMQERGMAGADLEMKTVTVRDGEEVEVVFEPGSGATIRGRVTRGDRPVAGAMVFLTSAEGGTETVDGMRFGTTDEQGDYEITDVPPGEFGISVSNPGTFIPVWSDRVVVTGGPIRKDLRLPPASIAGRVTDPRGRPVGGAQVVVVPAAAATFRSGTLDESMRSFGGISTTREDGGFRFEGVSPGEYALRVWKEGSAPRYSETFRVPDLGDGPQDLEVELSSGVDVTVEVRGPDRAPVAGAWVFATDPSGRILTAGMSPGVQTDSDGVARLRLAPGRYVLEVQASGLAVRAEEVEVPDGSLSLILDLEGGGTIVAEVRDAGGRPVADARVTLLDSSGRSAGRRMVGDLVSGTGHPTRTDAEGRIELDLVAPGSWRLVAATAEGAEGEAAVEVVSGRVARVKIVVED